MIIFNMAPTEQGTSHDVHRTRNLKRVFPCWSADAQPFMLSLNKSRLG